MHPTTNAKITLYLENVPTYHPITHKLMDEYELAEFIESICKDALEKNGISYCDPAEVVMGDPDYTVDVLEHTFGLCGDYYIENIQNRTSNSFIETVYPVGYLCPDGKWYLITEHDDRLAHIRLAKEIHDDYVKKGFKFNLRESGYYDELLEKNGFIKVHGSDIRYLAHFPCYNTDTGKAGHTPDVNEIQRKELARYCELLHDLDKRLYDYDSYDILVNEHLTTSIKLKQMDDLMLRNLFSL